MAKLSRKRRERLSSSEFACPSERKYPINDRAHVRNALARLGNPRNRACPEAYERVCERAKKLGVKSKVCRIE